MLPFGRIPDGRAARLFTLQNARGFRADVSDYGATLVRLFAPDRTGRVADVVLGFDDVGGYTAHDAYLGAVVGRVGNRIAGGKFTLDGVTYTLATNNRPAGLPCHLHGGHVGFDRALWQAEAGPSQLRLTHRSPNGDEGYPGDLDVTVTYTVTEDNALRLDYEARTDRATPVNLTHHAYFNLAGHDAGDVLGHELTLHAARFVPVSAGLIPLGPLAPVAGTPFDFRTPHAIGARIEADDEQLRRGAGYDHTFVLDAPAGRLAPAATVREPRSGRVLEVLTTEPGVQFYTGNFLAGAFAGKNGCRYARRGGFCLETQHFPDSPNQPAFPSVILRPGAIFRSTTVFRFSAGA